jgi:hypothetical protein
MTKFDTEICSYNQVMLINGIDNTYLVTGRRQSGENQRSEKEGSKYSEC